MREPLYLRSVPLLQRSGETFIRKAGCVSCHNNVLTAATISAARMKALPVDEALDAAQRARTAAYLETWRERTVQGHAIPGDEDTVSYLLFGLATEHYPADGMTDAMARFLRLRQRADGRWLIFAHRPPIEVSDIQVTAVAAHALQAYAPPSDRLGTADALRRAAAWLEAAPVHSTEDRAFQLLGLTWLQRRAGIPAASRELIATQHPDGGWSQIPTLESDAYATGQALVALVQSGAVRASDPVFRRGAAFLIANQRPDGSWLVRTRAVRIQPPLDAGFPYGRDQFISAAGTNWAAQALIYDAAAPSATGPRR